MELSSSSGDNQPASKKKRYKFADFYLQNESDKSVEELLFQKKHSSSPPASSRVEGEGRKETSSITFSALASAANMKEYNSAQKVNKSQSLEEIDKQCSSEDQMEPAKRQGYYDGVLQGVSLIWFRGHDLRIDDNPTVLAALQRQSPMVAIFIWDPASYGRWYPSKPWLWWLRSSLKVLEKELFKLGCKLLFRKGDSVRELLNAVKENNVSFIFWNRAYEPLHQRIDESVVTAFSSSSIKLVSFKSELLVEPWELQNKFSPFFPDFHSYMRAWMVVLSPPEALNIPEESFKLHCKKYHLFENSEVDCLELLSTAEIEEFERKNNWKPGCRQAHKVLKTFLDTSFPKFSAARYRRSLGGTSKLSPHLKFGELSVRRIFHAVRNRTMQAADDRHSQSQAAKAFLKNLCLREYAYHVLYYYPNAVDTPLQSVFNLFPWERDYSVLERFTNGHTGYPMVDAAIRELSSTGWIHNILRFLLASFLTRYLLLPWQLGAHFLYSHLIDGDLAANTLGWQWTAGCNTDSFPLSCLVNPVGMGRKYDSSGSYVRYWLPELASLPDRYIHCPWQAPEHVLSNANIELERTYPFPIVDVNFARNRAKEALRVMKQIVEGQHCPKSLSSPTVNDVIEEWPDDETFEQTTNLLEDNGITEQGSSALSLLPSLWQLLQHDSPPSLPVSSLDHLLFSSENEDEKLILNDLGFNKDIDTTSFCLDNNDASTEYMTNKLDELTAAQATVCNYVGSYSPPIGQHQISQVFPASWNSPHAAQGRRNYLEDIQLDPSVYSTCIASSFGRRNFTSYVSSYPGVGADSSNQSHYDNNLSDLPIHPHFGQGKPEEFAREYKRMDARHSQSLSFPKNSRTKQEPFDSTRVEYTAGSSLLNYSFQETQSSKSPESYSADKKKGKKYIQVKKESCLVSKVQASSSRPTHTIEMAPTTRQARRAILESIAMDDEHEGQLFAQFFLRFYDITDNVDRRTSRDFVRVRNIKDHFHQWCPANEKKLLKIYKIKSFLSDILNLEVTGEWDRHKHGGVRGPYVYGICPVVESYSTELFRTSQDERNA